MTRFLSTSRQCRVPSTPRPIALYWRNYCGILEYSGGGEGHRSRWTCRGITTRQLHCSAVRSLTRPDTSNNVRFMVYLSVSCCGIRQPILSVEINAKRIVLLRQAQVLPADFGVSLRITGKQVMCYHPTYQQTQWGCSCRLSIDIFDVARLRDNTMLILDATKVIQRQISQSHNSRLQAKEVKVQHRNRCRKQV